MLTPRKLPPSKPLKSSFFNTSRVAVTMKEAHQTSSTCRVFPHPNQLPASQDLPLKSLLKQAITGKDSVGLETLIRILRILKNRPWRSKSPLSPLSKQMWRLWVSLNFNKMMKRSKTSRRKNSRRAYQLHCNLKYLKSNQKHLLQWGN